MANMVEIDESQLLGLNRTAQTLKTILGHKDARKLVLQAQKLAMPDVSIPEVDAVNEGMGEIQKLRAEIEADRKERAEAAAKAEAEAKTRSFMDSWESSKRRLQVENGYTSEGIAAIEKLAQDRGIADLDAAAALFDRINPPAEPISAPGAGSWGYFDNVASETDYVTKLLKGRGADEAATNAEINAALADVRGISRRTA